MRSERTQVEVIAHFAKDQEAPIPLKVRIIEDGEPVVIKIEKIFSVKPQAYDAIRYECGFQRDGCMRRFTLVFWKRDMQWHIDK